MDDRNEGVEPGESVSAEDVARIAREEMREFVDLTLTDLVGNLLRMQARPSPTPLV